MGCTLSISMKKIIVLCGHWETKDHRFQTHERTFLCHAISMIVYINPPSHLQIPSIQPSSQSSKIINQHLPNPFNLHQSQTILSTKESKMKSQFIIGFLSLYLTAALAVPTAKRSNLNPIEVCTKSTDGEPCIVVEVDGATLEGRCIVDLASFAPVIYPPFFPSWGPDWERREADKGFEQLLPGGAICLIE